MAYLLKIILVIFVLALLSGCQRQNPAKINTGDNNGKIFVNQEVRQPKIRINNIELQIEVVRTPQAQIIGLSGRSELCQNCGMLFDFPDYRTRNFWMKDMNFPLDIIWIKDDYIVNISANVPLFTNGQITSVQSGEAVNKVLEVNANWAENNNVKIGDNIQGFGF